MAANYPPCRCALHPTSRYGRAMDRSQPSSQVSTTLSGVPVMLSCVVKQTPPKTLFKETIFTLHIFSMSTGAGFWWIFSSSSMIQLSEPCLFWILLLHWFRCPISGLLAPGKQLVRGCSHGTEPAVNGVSWSTWQGMEVHLSEYHSEAFGTSTEDGPQRFWSLLGVLKRS